MLLRGTHQAWSNKNSYIVYSLINLDITYRLVSISFSFDTKICTVLFIPGREETNGNGKWSQSGFPQGTARRQVLPIVFLMLKSLNLVLK